MEKLKSEPFLRKINLFLYCLRGWFETCLFYSVAFVGIVLLTLNVVMAFRNCNQPDQTRGIVKDLTLFMLNETFIPMTDEGISYIPEYYDAFYSSTIDAEEDHCIPAFAGSTCFRKVHWIMCQVFFNNEHFIHFYNLKEPIVKYTDIIKDGQEKLLSIRMLSLIDDMIYNNKDFLYGSGDGG